MADLVDIRHSILRCFVATSCFLVMACVGPQPLKEWVIAKSALDSAEKNGARKYAKGPLYQAEQLYAEAQSELKSKEHASAKNKFLEATKLAEQAETQARIKKLQSGDVEP